MERDEFLTKAINPDWFDGSYNEAPIIVFSSWFGFGRLWEWSRKQRWWEDFFEKTSNEMSFPHYVMLAVKIVYLRILLTLIFLLMLSIFI